MKKTSYCLFTGLGGANTGLQQSGYEDLGGIEINPNVAAIHNLNFKHKVNVGNVIDLACDVPKVDLLWASPPCQSFSLSNPNRKETNLEIELAHAVCVAIKQSQASEVVIENVPAYKKSNSFRIILEYLNTRGFQIQTSVLNAYDYGCPSNRPRMISRAVLKNRGLLPIEFFKSPSIGWYEALLNHTEKLPLSQPTKKQFRDETDSYAIERCGYYGHPKVWRVNNRFPTIKSHTHHDGKVKDKSISQIGSYRVAYNANIQAEFYAISPFGLSLLMGFPPDFNLGSSRAEAAAGIGNSVPPPLAYAIRRSLI